MSSEGVEGHRERAGQGGREWRHRGRGERPLQRPCQLVLETTSGGLELFLVKRGIKVFVKEEEGFSQVQEGTELKLALCTSFGLSASAPWLASVARG